MCFNLHIIVLPNKNNSKKKMEKFGYIIKCQKLLKQLSKVLVIVFELLNNIKGHSGRF